MQIDISIIVPVYNLEGCIERNLRSLHQIKLENTEFIYVNDGSQDRSSEIINTYAQKDSRIVLLNKDNGGLSDARNAGIRVARGEWITFVDGDDYIDPESFERFVDSIDNECDVIWGGYIQEPKGNSSCDDVIEEKTSGIEWIRRRKVDYCACIYLIKKKLIESNDIWFLKGCLHEDMDFVPKLFLTASLVKRVPIAYYRYVFRENSISNTKNIKRSIDLISISMQLNQFVSEKHPESLNEMGPYLVFLCSDALNLAVGAKIQISKVINDERVNVDYLISMLSKSRRGRDKFLAFCISHNLFLIYSAIYIAYDNMRKLRKKFK